MSRNNNKFYPPEQGRKTGSPNLARLAAEKQRNEEYRSSERETYQKTRDSDSLSKQKNTSNEAVSARPSQKGQIVQQFKDTRNSKSKERKDYMAVNLSRFNRKKEDVRSPSNTSERSNSNQPQEEKKQRYIYTFKDEIKAKEQVKSEYSALPSAISSKTSRTEQKTSRLEEKADDSKSRVEERAEMSEIRSNNTSIAVSARGKPLQVNLVKYEDRRESVREINREERQKQQAPSIAQTSSQLVIAEPQSQKRIPISETMRVQMQLNHQRESKYSEQLMTKLKTQRQEFSSRLRAIQRERLALQQENSNLLQEKYQIQAQLTIMANSNAQLQRELSNARDSAVRTNRQSQRTSKNNQQMFKELQNRYNSLLQEYRNATKRNSQLAMEVSEAEGRVEDLKNAVRSAEEQAKNRFLEVEKVRRIADARMQELQQEHEFQLKQMQIRTSDKNKRDLQLEETIRQLERKVMAKTSQLQERQREMEQMSAQLRDMQQLQDLFNSKCAENSNLIGQLNKSKDIIMKLSNENNELIRTAAQSAKEKDKEIKRLTESLAQLKSSSTMQRLATEAQQQLYGNSQGADSFQDLIKGQSQETNRLRSDIADKEEQIFKLRGDNDQLRERVRKLQQQSQMNARTYSMNLNNLKEVKEATEAMLKKRIAALQAARLH